MRTVTIFEVAELNEELKRRGLGYRVHMHDMCGGQSFDVEELPEGGHDEDELHRIAREKLGREL